MHEEWAAGRLIVGASTFFYCFHVHCLVLKVGHKDVFTFAVNQSRVADSRLPSIRYCTTCLITLYPHRDIFTHDNDPVCHVCYTSTTNNFSSVIKFSFKLIDATRDTFSQRQSVNSLFGSCKIPKIRHN